MAHHTCTSYVAHIFQGARVAVPATVCDDWLIAIVSHAAESIRGYILSPRFVSTAFESHAQWPYMYA